MSTSVKLLTTTSLPYQPDQSLLVGSRNYCRCIDGIIPFYSRVLKILKESVNVKRQCILMFYWVDKSIDINFPVI